MRTCDTIVIGAGQSGLAMSRCLADRGREHVVLERGLLAERWRSERWDSLRLLTPNWASWLPGWTYDGDDPDGFMTASEVVAYFERYARSFDPPVEEHTTVESLSRDGDTFAVETGQGGWRASNVVLATGWCDVPHVPAMASRLSPDILQVTPSEYRNPDDLPDGGVLVVGASSTGLQLAEELRRSGRLVVLAVGAHTRVPRSYRGRDIWSWLLEIGAFDATIDEMPDPERARNEPSLQLVGNDEGRPLDLPAMWSAGVVLTGRLLDLDGHHTTFADDLVQTSTAADQVLGTLLAQIDARIATEGLESSTPEAEPIATLPATVATDHLDLRARRIGTVVWATGYRRPYPWLRVPVLDERGELPQVRGVTSEPGLYVVGQRFQHYRSSNFIHGVGRDADHVAEHLARRARSMS